VAQKSSPTQPQVTCTINPFEHVVWGPNEEVKAPASKQTRSASTHTWLCPQSASWLVAPKTGSAPPLVTKSKKLDEPVAFPGGSNNDSLQRRRDLPERHFRNPCERPGLYKVSQTPLSSQNSSADSFLCPQKSSPAKPRLRRVTVRAERRPHYAQLERWDWYERRLDEDDRIDARYIVPGLRLFGRKCRRVWRRVVKGIQGLWASAVAHMKGAW
jgi:hypothetical protein